MRRSTKQLYVITSRNALTGAREVVSLPMERLEAIAAIKKDIELNGYEEERAFNEPRLAEWPEKQLELW